MVVMVHSSIPQAQQQRVYLTVKDASTEQSLRILLTARHHVDLVNSSCKAGSILILRGVEPFSSEGLFCISPRNYSTMGTVKLITDTHHVHNLYHHPQATELIQLSDKIRQALSLQPLSCRYQCLSEIQLPGMQCHVTVRVLDCHPILHSSTAVQQRYHKKHGSPTQQVYATLSDYKDTVMVLVDCQRLKSQLQEAVQSKHYIRITHLTSRQRHEELVLACTLSTKILSCDNPPFPRDTDCSTPNNTTIDNLQVVMASIESIFMDDLNQALDQRHFSSPAALCHALIQATPTTFRCAKLTLSVPNTAKRVVMVDAHIMQNLCGSVEAHSILHHAETRRTVLELLQGLLQEETRLKFVIQKDTQQVIKVELMTV